MSYLKVNDDFLFGTATAAYQIEGAVDEDGRTDSIWDTFAKKPGKVINGDSGQVACDSYHRYEQDLDLLADLGVDAYRFSIGVPRIIPTKDGVVNPKGLDYYNRVVDGLLERGIKPVVTLYHWDLPQYLEDEGGWMNRDTAYRMADYAGAVARSLGDRVHLWTTLNEPWCAGFLGYLSTEHAPGLGLGAQGLPAVHHLNLAHGLMASAVYAELGEDTKCSVTLNLQQIRTLGGADELARRMDAIGNRIFLDPMLRGFYPDDLFEATEGLYDWSCIQEGDLELIHQPLDSIGVNYYSTNTVAASDRRRKLEPQVPTVWPGCNDAVFVEPSGARTDMGWIIDPEGLYDQLLRLKNDYPEIPLMVTENGAAEPDELTVGEDGSRAVHDEARIQYLEQHFDVMRRAMDAGVNLRGYFLWSLLDNFEWALGYTKRFGIVHMDYETFERTPKDSFEWYKERISKREI